MANSKFLDLIRGYDTGAGEVSGAKFAEIRITGSSTKQTLHRTTRRFSDAIESIRDSLSVTSARAYGLFLLTFGVLTLLLHFIKDYFGLYETLPISTIIIGAVFLLLGIPLIVVDKPLAVALEEFPLTEFIFFEFFCLPVVHIKKTSAKPILPIVGLILGLLLAVLGAVVPLIYVIIGIVAIVYVCLTLIAPEFSYYLAFLLLPYVPVFDLRGGIILSILVVFTAISFIRKLISGKRIFTFEQYDLALFLMMVFVLISGIFVKGMESFTSSLTMVALALVYSLTSSIITNRRLADGLVKAIVASGVPVSIIAIVETIIALVNSPDTFGGASATFSTPGDLGIYLLISAVLSTYFVFGRRHKGTKILYGAITLLLIVAMAFTLQLWIFVTALIGVIAYIVSHMRRGSGLLLGAISLVPYFMLFMPGAWLTALSEVPFFSIFGLDTVIPVWINSRRMLLDNLLSGVGIGVDSFTTEYLKYTYVVAPPPNSYNLLLQIAVEAGVFALLSFLLIFLIRLKHRSIYAPYVNSSSVELLDHFTSVLVVVFFVYGMLASFWSDYTTYFIFWAVLGLGSATLRISKREYDDRIAYYSDGAGVDSSAIDITVRR